MLKVISNPEDLYIKSIDHDPVRPEIPWVQRCNPPSSLVFVSVDQEQSPLAVLCCTFKSYVPKSRDQLFSLESSSSSVAVFYTVWSYRTRSAGPLIMEAVQWIRSNYSHVTKFVTFSPHGSSVEKFHLGNGASILSVNEDSVNY